MKRLVVVAISVVLVAALAGSALAANSLQAGTLGISVGMGDSIFSHKAIPQVNALINDVVDINGRFFVEKDMALYGGFGLQTDGGDADGTYLGITIGARKYLKVDDFAPFIAGQLSYISVKADPNIADLSIIDLAGLFGAEFFVGKKFSLEGAIGVGIGQASDDINNAGDDTYFGTRTVGVKANFYF